jgi:CheY-like chemotaxis protein
MPLSPAGRKALLVDDDAELVELMSKVLEEDGRFEVRVASNGFDAGMMVKDCRPDIIILDVMLPDINGKEVCQRRWRADSRPGRCSRSVYLGYGRRRQNSRSFALPEPMISCTSRSRSNN